MLTIFKNKMIIMTIATVILAGLTGCGGGSGGGSDTEKSGGLGNITVTKTLITMATPITVSLALAMLTYMGNMREVRLKSGLK